MISSMRRFALPTVLAIVLLLGVSLILVTMRQNVQQIQTLLDETGAVVHTLEVQRQLDDVLLTQVTRPGKPDPDVEKLNAKLEELGSSVTPGTVALQPGQDFALPVPHAVTPVVMKPAFDQIRDLTVRWIEGE